MGECRGPRAAIMMKCCPVTCAKAGYDTSWAPCFTGCYNSQICMRKESRQHGWGLMSMYGTCTMPLLLKNYVNTSDPRTPEPDNYTKMVDKCCPMTLIKERVKRPWE